MKRGFTPLLMQTAREINESMFKNVMDMLEPETKKITILGLCFKPDVKSFETSHTLKLISLLTENGYDVTVHDPLLDTESFSFKTEADLLKAVNDADCLILATAHSQYKTLDFNLICRSMRGKLVIDVRGIFNSDKVTAANLIYKGVGRTIYA
jgi:UDP-N-acetyl-D-mannosaminuronate dehydrogenase